MEAFKIKAFGMLAEKLPHSEFNFNYCSNTEELLKELQNAHPVLKNYEFSIAVDKQLIQERRALKGGEEVALLPPFSGG